MHAMDDADAKPTDGTVGVLTASAPFISMLEGCKL
jgi:hypothetical protein